MTCYLHPSVCMHSQNVSYTQEVGTHGPIKQSEGIPQTHTHTAPVASRQCVWAEPIPVWSVSVMEAASELAIELGSWNICGYWCFSDWKDSVGSTEQICFTRHNAEKQQSLHASAEIQWMSILKVKAEFRLFVYWCFQAVFFLQTTTHDVDVIGSTRIRLSFGSHQNSRFWT